MIQYVYSDIYFLLKLVSAVDNYSPDEKGLEFGQPAHVLDVAEIVHECWKELSQETIAGCWRRANCLPIGQMEPVPPELDIDRSQVGPEESQVNVVDCNQVVADTVNEILDLFQSKFIRYFIYPLFK